MKIIKSIGISLLTFVLGLASCEDILTVDSSRYTTVDENTLTSPNDSVSSILGLLSGLQDIGERYILLGEMRADLLDVTDFTSAGIRELSNFTVSDTSVYADSRDYYAIVNNCNYLISRTSDDNSPLKKENALAHAIRAWTYMQIVFNWGKASYFTEPLLSVNDTQKEFPEYTIPELSTALIADLEPLVGADYPNYGTIYEFESSELFFPVEVLLGDLYLWRGASTDDYATAARYYAEYIDRKTLGNRVSTPSAAWEYIYFTSHIESRRNGWSRETVAQTGNSELVTAIQMATDVSEGKVNNLQTNYREFAISKVMEDLWDDQSYVLHYIPATGSASNYFTTGDLRKWANVPGTIRMVNAANESFLFPYLYKIFNAYHFQIYRLGLLYLRYAEAMNRAGYPHIAFAVLKYGLSPLTLADATRIPPDELAAAETLVSVFNTEKFTTAIGVHARGCGDTAYNPYYTIAKEGEILESPDDTIRRVEDLICTELALETSFEGNRFQDLMRFALRRNDPAFLAKQVASKHEDDYNRIYNWLLNKENWYLPHP
ncbi:MAG: RagB/SusD family nutrient uptake outer membrane protein [Dysgonamonadaceae bacterium]|nr:RagB/SusD family nutrient uptake outer membrane protein [Dysgonamonadaceae bacterium]